MELYAGIKNVDRRIMASMIEERLKAVRLFNVKDKPTKTYSGG